MTKHLPGVLLGALILALPACRPAASTETGPSPAGDTPFVHAASTLEAGRYLIEVGGCHDCHTPGFMEHGPDIPEEQWLVGMPVGFRGPWGTSYASNLRLVAASLSEDAWVTMLQTRNALPPMPWPSVHAMSEQDLRALHAYIVSLGEAGQPAPRALPPGEEPATPYFDFVPQHMERLAGLAGGG